MKKNRSFISAILVAALLVTLHVNAEKPKPEPNEKEKYSMIDGVKRGFANMFTCWLEVPRGMTYYSVEYPVIGIIPGAFEGGGMTLIRAVGGMFDVLTIGYLRPGNTVYDTMDAPMLPWEAPWLPTPENEEE